MASNNSICSYDVKNNLRSMIGYRYDNDHDFYEQLKKAIYYDGETYIGVCERLIELIDGCCQDQHKPDAKREAAADWVEEQGGIEEAKYTVEKGNAYRDQLSSIIKYLGAASRENPVLSDKDLYDRIISELDKRLMPPGVEWPKFKDGEKVNVGDYIMHDGSGERVQGIYFYKSSITLSLTGIDHEKLHTVEYGERIMRPETEVLGADGLPIKVGDTVYFVSGSEPYRVESLPKREDGMIRLYGLESKSEKLYCYYPDNLTHTQPDTQERINEDVCKVADACTYFSSDGSCAKCKLVSQYGDAGSAYEECPKSVELDQMAILDLLRRQRELDARTIGGDAS